MNKTGLTGAVCAGLILAIAGPALASSGCAALNGALKYSMGTGETVTVNQPSGNTLGTGFTAGDKIVLKIANAQSSTNENPVELSIQDTKSLVYLDTLDNTGSSTYQVPKNTSDGIKAVVILNYPKSGGAATKAATYNFTASWSCSGP